MGCRGRGVERVDGFMLRGRGVACGALPTESGGTYSYPVIFILDENGLWKIKGL